MKKEFVFGVIGAGNGGKAMAAYLALLGKKVLLYNRTFFPRGGHRGKAGH